MTIFRFLLIFLFAATSALASPGDELSFADSLATDGDHYRAITEYKRFLHYHPDAPRAAYAQLQIARSLIAGERWAKADQALERVWTRYPASREAAEARQLYADSAFERGDYEGAADRYQRLEAPSSGDPGGLALRRGLTALHLGRTDEAERLFGTLDTPETRQLSEQFRRLPRKSPRLAATLSALLPGAGQLYTERPRQAGIAFALNAAFIYAAVESWENDNHAVSGILSLFELGWYGGNIFNALNNAHKINRERENRFLRNVERRFGLSFGWRDGNPQLRADFRF